ncbi:MAG: hypothetical protein OFPII_02710 [Osedax symbiont Rs1]|nr:MAG: hypothetical protein OFPII_02710 [Osedax symbiont Rs1]
MSTNFLVFSTKISQWYNQIGTLKQKTIQYFIFTLVAYHVALMTSFIGVFLNISFYSANVFFYLLLIVYFNNIVIALFCLKPKKSTLKYVKKMQLIQIVNWLVLFSIWCFFMANQRSITLVCAMMVISFLFAYSTFWFSFYLNLLIVFIYLVICYIGGTYFGHNWDVSNDILYVIAYLFSAMMLGTMVHRTTLLLRRQVNNDFLTKLLNRRAMNMYIQEEFLRCERFNTPVSLVMIDLDNFKSINDKYGHNCGDAVLIHVADHLKKHIREIDHLARWGGEEFLALLIGVAPGGAEQVIQRALKRLSESPVKFKNISINVSFSAGISSLNDYSSSEASIQEADRLLYVSKNEGKARVNISLPSKPSENLKV